MKIVQKKAIHPKTLLQGAHIIDPAAKLNAKSDILLVDGHVADVKPFIDAPSDASGTNFRIRLSFPGSSTFIRTYIGEELHSASTQMITAGHPV